MSDKEENLLRMIDGLEKRNQDLQARLEEAEEALRAITTGEVDALVVYGDENERIYTLQGADHAYRVIVESIHEGAANINDRGIVLYSNKRLAEMLEMPLETVLGASFLQFLSPAEQENFKDLIRKGLADFGRMEFNLTCYKGSTIPVLVTASAAEVDGRRGVCLVITDLTDQKQAIARERELQIRLMEQREDERMRIARNLHDGPLQDVLGLSYTIQAMIPSNPEQATLGQRGDKDIAAVYQTILKLAGDLRNVCNELRPPSTIRFGLAKAIQYQSDEIKTKYPHLTIQLELAEDHQLLSKDLTTTLFRVYQECMNNILRHANATVVNVRLLLDQASVRLEVQDNGKGFFPPEDWVELAREGHLGLVGMRERVEAVGGKIRILSGNCHGTSIQVEVPKKPVELKA